MFNLIIGNNDAHGKNFSLLYKKQTRLAPFYDMISTIHYPALAMKIGSKYDFDILFPRHIAQMAAEAKLSVALVQKETLNLIRNIQNTITDGPFSSLILQRAEKLSQKFES